MYVNKNQHFQHIALNDDHIITRENVKGIIYQNNSICCLQTFW